MRTQPSLDNLPLLPGGVWGGAQLRLQAGGVEGAKPSTAATRGIACWVQQPPKKASCPCGWGDEASPKGKVQHGQVKPGPTTKRHSPWVQLPANCAH